MTVLDARAAEVPRARVDPTGFKHHGVTRVDDYYWLRERGSAEVTGYLEAENSYTEEVMAPTGDLQETLFEEIKGRIKQTDMSVPYRQGDYTYFTRYENGREYPIHCRRPLTAANDTGVDQVLVDVNVVAEGHDFCQVAGLVVSPDQRRLAYSTDLEGRRVYTVRIKDLETGELLADTLENVTPNVTWAADSQTLFYTRQDPTTLRWHQIYRHRLGTPQEEDVLVYQEDDDTFNCEVGKTRSKQFLLIASSQTVSTEYRYLNADTPDGEFQLFLGRERDHEYHLDHFQGRFFIRTNREAQNFKLMETAEQELSEERWSVLVPHSDDVLLGAFELFDDYLVLQERREGLVHLHVRPWAGDGAHHVAFDEPVFDSYIGVNREPDTQVLRFGYESLTTPSSTYDYDMASRNRILLKREEVLGGFDPEQYEAERLFATAADGERVPISLVAGKGTPRDGSAPLLLYGYGAYGISMDPAFNSARLSLLDRGFIYAIAHIRGGQELGRRWYDAGRLGQKQNTFSDFIACAEFLVRERRTGAGQLFAMGGSAGGLLLGAVVNQRPDLFAGAVAQVPFVDVVTTMLDETIPLTTGEYDEWGNPSERQAFEDILAYSPYDNVTAQDYPALLVLAGLHDSQVQYWEPAKWVAKLRAFKTDNRPLLLKTNMDAGHGGVSGRYRRYREVALQYAFLLAEADLV
ncbi:MAG: oligopeptidase B [Acidobacteria bacterium]|nr:oligopeptidase B [Acidobacteriota bacterium]